jgi:hypothetical protein
MSPSYEEGKTEIEIWQSLVHVCRRWRSLVLTSPRRLNLRLVCTPKTPAKDALDIWPVLPLIVTGHVGFEFSSSTDNVIAALGQSNRVCQVDLDLGFEVDEVLAAIQVPFPELKYLRLRSYGSVTVIPDSFLGGFAPRLRYVSLDHISFLGLPNLLLSANHLVYLGLTNIPHSGYISPEAMVAPLCALSSLETLNLKFLFESRPDRESPSLPPPKRSILPVLDKFHFEGDAEYLEELLTFIDAPELDEVHIKFVFQMDFDCPRLVQFINRTPTFRAHNRAHVRFDNDTSVALLARWPRSRTLKISIPYISPSERLSFFEQVCNSSLHPLSTVKHLYIDYQYPNWIWSNAAIERTLWLQLFLPFTAVKNLSLSRQSVPGVAAALQGLVGGRITEVLPSLRNIKVFGWAGGLGRFKEYIGQFAAARRRSGHPIAISVSEVGGISGWYYSP